MLFGACSACCCNYLETVSRLQSYDCSVTLSGVGPKQDAGSVRGTMTWTSPACINDSWFDNQVHESGRTLRVLQEQYPQCGIITAYDESHEVTGTYQLAYDPSQSLVRDLDARLTFFVRQHNTQIAMSLTVSAQLQGGVVPFPDTRCQVLCALEVAWNPLHRGLSYEESCQHSYRQFVGPITARDQGLHFLLNREASAAWLTSQYEDGTWRAALPSAAPSGNPWNNVNVPRLWTMNRFVQLTPYSTSGGNGQPITVSFFEDNTTVSAQKWVPGSAGKENFSYAFTGPPVYGHRAYCGALQVSGDDTYERYAGVLQQTSITPTVTLTPPES